MPKPSKPWIAVDFSVAATQVSFTRDGSDEIVDEYFPNVFLYDDDSKEIDACVDVDALESELAGKVFVLKPDDIKPNATIVPPGSSDELPIIKVLAALFARVREEFQKNYFNNEPVDACHIVCNSKIATDSKIAPDPILKAAACEAGFKERDVEVRRRESTIVQAVAIEKKLRRELLVLCDASVGYFSLALFKRCGDGYALDGASWNNHRAKIGIDYVVDRVARSIVGAGKALKRDLTPFAVPVARKALQKLRETDLSKKNEYHVYWDRVRFDGKKALEKETKRYYEKIEPLFVEFFSELASALKGRAFEILVVGPGANLPGLKETLNSAAPSPADIKILGDRNAAKDWCKMLYAMEVLPRNPSNAQKEYHKTYAAALKGSLEDQYKLGKMYASGEGCVCCFEETFYWMKRAAHDDYAKAWYKIAKCYSEGIVVARDEDEARKAYLRSAELGYPKAQYKAALIFQREGSDQKMRHWMSIAAEKGYAPAKKAAKKLKLDLYKDGDEEAKYNLDPVLKKPKRDWEWLEMLVGVLLAALVFYGGSMIAKTFKHGALQAEASEAVEFLCVLLSLAMIVVGSCFAFSKLLGSSEK